MEFEGGVTAAFSMVAFTEEICKRKTTIHGSKVGLSLMSLGRMRKGDWRKSHRNTLIIKSK